MLVTTQGKKDHPFFFREHMLEAWRRGRSPLSVSRFRCTFAFDNLEDATEWCDEERPRLYRVEPVRPDAATHRADMVHISAVGAAGQGPDEVDEVCAAYWTGQPTANPWWELLIDSDLRVVEVVL